MNQKILAGLMIAVIVLVSIHLAIVINDKAQFESDILDKNSVGIGHWTGTAKYVEHEIIGFNIETQDDLTEIVGLLVDEMYEKEIFLSMKDVVRLTGLDMDRMQITPNDMYGFSSRNSTYHEGYTYHEERNDGTRIQEKFSNNGTLLKSIKIYDEPEKEILILLK